MIAECAKAEAVHSVAPSQTDACCICKSCSIGGGALPVRATDDVVDPSSAIVNVEIRLWQAAPLSFVVAIAFDASQALLKISLDITKTFCTFNGCLRFPKDPELHLQVPKLGGVKLTALCNGPLGACIPTFA